MHLENVKALNVSVCSWIKKHVDVNPYVDLTPIFRDYDKHMQGIDEKFLGVGGTKEQPVFAVPSTQGVSIGGSTTSPNTSTKSTVGKDAGTDAGIVLFSGLNYT